MATSRISPVRFSIVFLLLACAAACNSRQEPIVGIHLVVVGGVDAGKDLSVQQRRAVTIGRNKENDLVLSEEHISRRHAIITPLDVGYTLTDVGTEGAGSTNGTSLHGKRLAPLVPVPLRSGDVFDVAGSSQVRFDDLSEKK